MELQVELATLLHAGFPTGLLFNPEYGNSMLLQNTS
jgi:hypothetical protein